MDDDEWVNVLLLTCAADAVEQRQSRTTVILVPLRLYVTS